MPKREIIIGTRSSRLAVIQAETVAEMLRGKAPGVAVRLEFIASIGDRIKHQPLERIGGEGLFTRAVDEAVVSGRVDCAVHSMKDLPVKPAAGTVIAAVPERCSPFDAFVSRDGVPFGQLSPGAGVLVGSPRRRAFLKRLRPDIECLPVRGNVETRLRKLREGVAVGLVVAEAALQRFGMQATESFECGPVLPAAGQGALAVTARCDDVELLGILCGCDDHRARCETAGERAFLAGIGAGCHTPAGVLGRVLSPDRLELRAAVLSSDGAQAVEGSACDVPEQADALGHALAADLLDRGADAILKGK